MKSKLIISITGVIILAGAVFLTVLLMNNKPQAQKKQKQQSSLYVKAQTVLNKPVESAISHQGRISSYETVTLSAEVNGRIMQGNIVFKEGERFKKGDLLIRIYDDDIIASLTASKSNFLQKLSAILPDLKIDFPKAYNKWNVFFNSIKVDEPLPLLPEFQSDKEQIFISSKGILSEYYSISSQEINLNKYKIYAPFDGTFKSIQRYTGAVAGMGVILATIVRTDRLEMVVPVPPKDAKWIEPGVPVTITGEDTRTSSGSVSRVADFIDETTQTVKVYVDYIPQGKQAFKIGEFAIATFHTDQQVEGIKLPREALINGKKVYVVKNNRVQLKNVTTARKLPDHVIISGLNDGETVVIESLVDISEGDKVKIK
jgi:multidrug efflux pump subunit AcrA (membrane-fusion protein)